MSRRALPGLLGLALAAALAGEVRAQQPVGAVDVEVTVDARGEAQVEERYLVAPFRGAVELRALTRPCAGIQDVRVERSGVATPILQQREGPWLVVQSTTAIPGDDTLRLSVRYEVRRTGTDLDIPLIHLTTPIPQEDGEREGTVRVRVRFADQSSRVLFPHMDQRGTEWEARYVAIPSFVQTTLGGGEGARATGCAATGGPAGNDGGLVWRFLLLVGIMGAWVPLYLAWARRSGDGDE